MTFEMRETIENLLRHAEDISELTLFGGMFAGSFFEYVFPPIPGDLWTAAGAILIARGHKFLIVFLGVNLGSLAGFLVDVAFGRWLANPSRRFRHWGPRWERLGRGVDSIARGFERHPALYLVVNRFLPGVRALFFVAAGFARVPLWKVIVFGLVSSVAWNLGLIGVGIAVGKNLDLLLDWLGRYTWAVWGVMAVVAVVILVRFVRARRRRAVPEPIDREGREDSPRRHGGKEGTERPGPQTNGGTDGRTGNHHGGTEGTEGGGIHLHQSSCPSSPCRRDEPGHAGRT